MRNRITDHRHLPQNEETTKQTTANSHQRATQYYPKIDHKSKKIALTKLGKQI